MQVGEGAAAEEFEGGTTGDRRVYGIRLTSFNIPSGGTTNNTANVIFNNSVTNIRATVSPGNRDIAFEDLIAGTDTIVHNSAYHTGSGVTNANWPPPRT